MTVYTSPAFLINGIEDEVAPFHGAVAVAAAMRERNVKVGLVEVKG